MLTPRRDLIQPSKSLSSTPYSKMQRADSDPIRQLSFNGVVTPLSKVSTIFENTRANEEVPSFTQSKGLLHKTPNVESEEDLNVDVIKINKPLGVADESDELNIEGALTDELKILQDKNRHLNQQIEVIFVLLRIDLNDYSINLS